MWKVENLRNELDNIVKEISNQSVQNAFYFFLVAYSKILRKKKLKAEVDKKTARTCCF